MLNGIQQPANSIRLSLFVAVLVLTSLTSQAQEKAATSTLDNLITAFNGESNAEARYTAFAVRADEEGFKGVASLFRAAAKAEGVHAANHKKVIEGLGGKADPVLSAPEVKTTAENLKAAIEGESYERDTMYPQFIAQARKEGNKKAVRTFDYAVTAEEEHANLYKSALDNLDAWKEARPFYVCSVCGYTTTNLDFQKCLSCNKPRDNYISVN